MNRTSLKAYANKLEEMRSKYPIRVYRVAVNALDAQYERDLAILNRELVKAKKDCKHEDTYYNVGPDGFCECLECGKIL